MNSLSGWSNGMTSFIGAETRNSLRPRHSKNHHDGKCLSKHRSWRPSQEQLHCHRSSEHEARSSSFAAIVGCPYGRSARICTVIDFDNISSRNYRRIVIFADTILSSLRGLTRSLVVKALNVQRGKSTRHGIFFLLVIGRLRRCGPTCATPGRPAGIPSDRWLPRHG